MNAPLARFRFFALAVATCTVAAPAFAYQEVNQSSAGALQVNYFGSDRADFTAPDGRIDGKDLYYVNNTSFTTGGCPIATVAYPEFGDPASTDETLDVGLDFASIGTFTTRSSYDNDVLFYIEVHQNQRLVQWRPVLKRELFVEQDFGGGVIASRHGYKVRLDTVDFANVSENVTVRICGVAPRTDIRLTGVRLQFVDFLHASP